jgi:hypothetical protein
VWTVTRTDPETEPIASVWPGAAYVNAVGLHGYFTSPGATFSTVFGATLQQARALTSDPVVITETGASPQAGRPRAITSLFAGAAAARIAGIIWFDYNKYSGHDWYIDNDPAALAAFRKAARVPPVP